MTAQKQPPMAPPLSSPLLDAGTMKDALCSTLTPSLSAGRHGTLNASYQRASARSDPPRRRLRDDQIADWQVDTEIGNSPRQQVLPVPQGPNVVPDKDVQIHRLTGSEVVSHGP